MTDHAPSVANLTPNKQKMKVTLNTQMPPPRPRFVSAPELLEELWSDACRPSLRWLQRSRKLGLIPSVEHRGRVFYEPDRVAAALVAAGSRMPG